MSLVLANIDATFRKPYVFHGFGNVGSTKTMLLRTQECQNLGFRRFSISTIPIIFDFSLWRPERSPEHKKSMLLDKKKQPSGNKLFQGTPKFPKTQFCLKN